jgi:N-formylglutamate deformylase
MGEIISELIEGDGPLIAVANHHGHALRDDVAALIALSDEERFREEDPYTGDWSVIAPTRLVARQSRFEVDLNRPREEAIYKTPETAWGLDLWKEPLPDAVIDKSLAEYDAYYAELHRICTAKKQRYGKFVILDLHSYNHRRDGPDLTPADPAKNPEVNIGTGTMDRSKWTSLVDRFMSDLHAFDFLDRHLDVRENVKFVGRGFPKWTHTTFPESGCVLAIEFKKFFMDEWTGKLDHQQHNAIRQALEFTVNGILEELNKLGVNI